MPLVIIGFLQAVCVAIYCGLVSLFFRFMEKGVAEIPEVWAPLIMLMLLVLSASVMGLVVFGYPVYLLQEKKIKEALILLAWTFLFIMIFVFTVIAIIVA